MEVICLEDAAFYTLVENVVARLKGIHNQEKEKWISDEEAMTMLKISSKTTLQKFRDQGKIRFTQPEKRIILYDRNSILTFLEQHARNTF